MEKFIDKIDYYPKTCLIELCYKCNLKCKHCGSSLNAPGTYREGDPLTLDQFKQFVRDLKELGCEYVILTGGEPLLSDCWEELARFSRGLGLKVSLITNGLAITEEIVRHMKSAGIQLVSLSLDGTKELHNYMRNNPHAYDQVIKAANLLKKYGLQVNFLTTVTNKNIDHLKEIEDIVYSLKGDYWQLQLGVSMGSLAEHTELVIKPESLINVEKFILEAKERGRVEISTSDTIGYFSDNELELRNNSSTDKNRIFCGCMAGCLCVALESNGNVKGCLSLQHDQFIEGNIKEKSIKEIWKDKNSFSYNRQFDSKDLSGYCRDCEYGSVCRGGCSSIAYSATGQLHNNPYCLYRLNSTLPHQLLCALR